MERVRRFRERLVLGVIVRYLDGDEDIVAWTHASLPEVRAPGILIVTNHRCVLHVASTRIPDISTPLSELTGFALDRRDPEVVRVCLVGEGHEVDVELSLSNRLRSRSVGRVLSALTQRQVAGPASFNPELTSPVPPMVRSARHHARRVWVTVLGVLILMVSAVFASPFVPGPGALTAVAGIAILAREYEWARDLHVWSSRQADRFIAWVRGLRGRRRAPAAVPTEEPGEPRGQALEAEVPAESGPSPERPASPPGRALEAEVPVPAEPPRRKGWLAS